MWCIVSENGKLKLLKLFLVSLTILSTFLFLYTFFITVLFADNISLLKFFGVFATYFGLIIGKLISIFIPVIIYRLYSLLRKKYSRDIEIGILIFSTLLIALSLKTDFIKTDSTKSINGYQNIFLNQTMDDVLYAKGRPYVVNDDIRDIDNELIQFIIKRGGIKLITQADIDKNPLHYKGYREWRYKYDYSENIIVFDINNKVKSISCLANPSPAKENKLNNLQKICEINNVSLFTNEADILKIYGNPSEQSISDSIKTIKYTNLNLTFQLAKFEVIRIDVGN